MDAARERERLAARKYYNANKAKINAYTLQRYHNAGKREAVLQLNNKLRGDAEAAIVELLNALELKGAKAPPIKSRGRFDTRCIHVCRAATTFLMDLN